MCVWDNCSLADGDRNHGARSPPCVHIQFSSDQSLGPIEPSVTWWTAACQASLSITNIWSLLQLKSIESVIPSNHLIFCRPLLSLLSSIFPSMKVFPMCQSFTSGGQVIGASASASVLPMNIQYWFTLGLPGLIFLLSKELWRVCSKPQFKSINSLVLSFLYGPVLTSTHDYWKNCSLDYMNICS